MEIIRNKSRSYQQSRCWAMIPLVAALWFFYWSIIGEESDFLRYMWCGVGFLIFAVTRWFFAYPTTGIHSLILGDEMLTIEYFGGSVLEISRDKIHSIKHLENQARVYYFRDEELCTCVLPKKGSDKESWEKVQQLEEML